ncbi:VOC family protein [Streptomyces minutiscleroticus]|uniref:VOC family protein n=1 Tax=Streptomyces minutiscleroticus TaxID=68238 RepID=UPI00332D0A8F
MLTTRSVTGAPNWLDVGTSDLAGATAFYRALFGWDFRPAGPGGDGYGMFRLADRTVAGGMQTTPEMGPPSWTVYFRTPEADATAKAAENAGGGVPVPPTDITDQGRMALLTDQAGAVFALWQPGLNQGLETVGTPGSLCWTELHTPDVARAAAFYAAVFGWQTSAVRFPGGVYTSVRPAGTEVDASFGGFVPLNGGPAGRDDRPYWLPYFAVTDADAAVAAAQERGGTVRTPVTDVTGVGRTAGLADPYGARFAVIEGVPQRQG